MKEIIRYAEESRRGVVKIEKVLKDDIISSIKTVYPNGKTVINYYDLYEDQYRVRTAITVFPIGEKRITRYYYGNNGDLLRIAVKYGGKVAEQYKYVEDYYTGKSWRS